MKDYTKTRWIKKDLPQCDFCSAIAHYDGQTVNGRWAYMCKSCFHIFGNGLGLGIGQELIIEVTANG